MRSKQNRFFKLSVRLILSIFFAVLVSVSAAGQTASIPHSQDCTQQAKNLSAFSPSPVDAAFLNCFAQLPPQERLRWWKSGTNSLNANSGMTDVVMAQGTDAAPLLAEIVRDNMSPYRFYALKLLCDMDKFVPVEQLPFPHNLYTGPVNGMSNSFMVVDGRRIGPEAYATVKWAAAQMGDEDLRFNARKYSGLLDQDFAQLSLADVVVRWREAAIKCRGLEGLGVKDCSIEHHLDGVLIARAPTSLPALSEMLQHDPSGYVREHAIVIVRSIDNKIVRLRGISEGREAIEAVRRAVERGGLRPTYTKKELRKELWENLEAQFLHDYWHIRDKQNAGISLDWYIYAKALHKLHGAETENPPIASAGREDVRPEIRRFITYLTEIDPYFPSWEFVHPGFAWEGLTHPQFRQKIARYYDQWKTFKETRNRVGLP